MMKISTMVAATTLAMSAGVANAATTFTANNEDVDFVVEDGFNYIVAVFDNAADLNTAMNGTDVVFDNAIPGIFGSPDLVSGEVAVGTGNSFVVGLSSDNGVSWIEDNGFTGTTTGVLNFSFANVSVDILVVDVQAVPVPASAWLFGTGLLGLAGVARRKA